MNNLSNFAIADNSDDDLFTKWLEPDVSSEYQFWQYLADSAVIERILAPKTLLTSSYESIITPEEFRMYLLFVALATGETF